MSIVIKHPITQVYIEHENETEMSKGKKRIVGLVLEPTSETRQRGQASPLDFALDVPIELSPTKFRHGLPKTGQKPTPAPDAGDPNLKNR